MIKTPFEPTKVATQDSSPIGGGGDASEVKRDKKVESRVSPLIGISRRSVGFDSFIDYSSCLITMSKGVRGTNYYFLLFG